MSRIGKLPIAIPAGVTVAVSPENVVTVKGPKGELCQAVDPIITVTVEDGVCHVTRPNDEKECRAKHGLYRALIHNMVYGVSEGYKATLELVGVGYRVELAQPQVLNFSLGYTHPIYLGLPNNCLDKFAQRFVPSANPNLTKVKVFASKVRSFVVKLVNLLVNNKKGVSYG